MKTEVLCVEFHEKLQELRRRRGLTQEELAQALYVSRTAVSKWESGRGYPSIDSLKEISGFFSVSIDELLSGEKLISIAEKEKQAGIRKLCELLFGVVDLLSLALIVLPLYPHMADGYVYSVNLFAYAQAPPVNRGLYWAIFLLLALLGAVQVFLTRRRQEKRDGVLTEVSVGLHVLIVLILGLTRQAYAVVTAFVLLLIKAVLLAQSIKANA